MLGCSGRKGETLFLLSHSSGLSLSVSVNGSCRLSERASERALRFWGVVDAYVYSFPPLFLDTLTLEFFGFLHACIVRYVAIKYHSHDLLISRSSVLPYFYTRVCDCRGDRRPRAPSEKGYSQVK